MSPLKTLRKSGGNANDCLLISSESLEQFYLVVIQLLRSNILAKAIHYSSTRP